MEGEMFTRTTWKGANWLAEGVLVKMEGRMFTRTAEEGANGTGKRSSSEDEGLNVH